MKEIISIGVVVLITVAAILFVEPSPRSTVSTVTVVAPEVQKISDYKRPVREGNCWRQFIGRGDTDSILVCH
jgi:hypothetical protein